MKGEYPLQGRCHCVWEVDGLLLSDKSWKDE